MKFAWNQFFIIYLILLLTKDEKFLINEMHVASLLN